MQNTIVSSDREQLILVDEMDNETGFLSKAECHDGEGKLHRAFSVFVFDDEGRLLLQQRGSGKRLWPGYWSNSCCSHPRKGESLEVATGRRLSEELGIGMDLEFVYRFRYQAKFDEQGSEHELCSVYVGRCNAPVRPNQTEIDAIQFLSAEQLEQELASRAGEFTPWFRQEWACLSEEHPEILQSYVVPLR